MKSSHGVAYRRPVGSWKKAALFGLAAWSLFYGTFTFGMYHKVENELSELPLTIRKVHAASYVDFYENRLDLVDKYVELGPYLAAKKHAN